MTSRQLILIIKCWGRCTETPMYARGSINIRLHVIYCRHEQLLQKVDNLSMYDLFNLTAMSLTSIPKCSHILLSIAMLNLVSLSCSKISQILWQSSTIGWCNAISLRTLFPSSSSEASRTAASLTSSSLFSLSSGKLFWPLGDWRSWLFVGW